MKLCIARCKTFRRVALRTDSRRFYTELIGIAPKARGQKADFPLRGLRPSKKTLSDVCRTALNEIQYGGRQRRKEKRKMIHSFCIHKSTETPKL